MSTYNEVLLRKDVTIENDNSCDWGHLRRHLGGGVRLQNRDIFRDAHA